MQSITKKHNDKTNGELGMFIHLFKLILTFFHSSAVGVGFYGNSETNDGVYQLTYSLYNANHTLGGINNLVREACQAPLYNLQWHQHYLYHLQFQNIFQLNQCELTRR